MKLPICKG